MDALLFHPKIVHLPIALAVLMPLFSGGLLVSWLLGLLPQRTVWLAVALQAVLIGSSFLAVETGGHEEERVEAAVPEAAIEAHEEAGELFAWATLLPLPFLVTAALVRRGWMGQAATGAGVLATLVVTGLGFRVGEAGGALVYTHNAGVVYSHNSSQSVNRPRSHDDDDD